MSESTTERGGFKEVVFEIRGRGAYSRLKFENGVNRVQRVRATEAQGRIHTSTATVVVMPEAEDVDVVINPERLKVDVYRSGGHGGQSGHTTGSAGPPPHQPPDGGGAHRVLCQRQRLPPQEQAEGERGRRCPC